MPARCRRKNSHLPCLIAKILANYADPNLLPDVIMPPNPSLPALVIQFSDDDQPAYLGEWLSRNGQPWKLINTAAGGRLPLDLSGFGGLALLGGGMSAYDDLPVLQAARDLIGVAVEQDIPVLGHCLGGQLLAQVLGAEVAPGPQPEMGWQAVSFNDDFLVARYWLGARARQTLMHWHYDAFSLPPGAVQLARSADCVCQAFAVGELHLGMQFHIEVDREKIETWLEGSALEVIRNEHLRSVQTLDQIAAGIEQYLPASQDLANHIYTRWRSRFRVLDLQSARSDRD